MGFPRLLSIFYCTFHPIQGPKVLYEVPEGSILSKTAPLVDFDSISEYLIPKVELCSKLVTISTPTCKVIGYPINLEHKKFQRNALMFNLAFVFDKDAEISSYEPVVRKMARVLKALEKECEFLSRQTKHAMVDSITTTSSISTIVATIAPTFAPSSTLSSTLIPTPEGQANATSNAPTPSTESAQANASSTLEPPVQGMASMSVTDATAPSNSTNSSPATGATGSPAIFSPLPSNAIVLSADPTSASTLHPPAPSAGAVQIPPTTSNITSTAFMASPPSIANGSIASVLTAPLSSSPFPPAKSSSISSQKQITNSQPLLHDSHTDGSGMQNLIEQLIEDLNSYCECQIPIDSANTINLKLFPTYPNPSPVYDYQVPIATVNLEALTDVNWDMTMQRITGHINGVNSVKRIAEYADVETGLARMCMGHLLYYGCIIMVDLFQFKNIYAVKMEMMRLTEDVALQVECVNYVTLPDMHAPSFAKIFSLYSSLQYGVVLQDWIEQNHTANYNIDVRRFISFGVIKGFLYRVHKYPILDYYDPVAALAQQSAQSAQSTPLATSSTPATTPAATSSRATVASTPTTTGTPSTATRIHSPLSHTLSTPALATNATIPSAATTTLTTTTTSANALPTTPAAVPSIARKMYGSTLAPTDQGYFSQHHGSSAQQQSQPSAGEGIAIPPVLVRLLDGQHHYDELCTQFGCSVRQLDAILSTDSRVKFIYR